MLLRIEKKAMEPDITILEFSGKITLTAERYDMEKMVDDLVRQNRRKFIFDLAGVEYIDSSGMGSIVQCFTKVKQAGGGFRVVGLQDRVRQLFKITRVDQIIPFYPTVPAALESPW